MLDEFAAMGPYGIFLLKNIASAARASAVKLMTVWQSVDQMQSIYPKGMGKPFMGTAQGQSHVYG